MRRYKAEDNEGHMQGDNLSTFSERKAQNRQQDEDKNELNKKDARDEAGGNEQV